MNKEEFIKLSKEGEGSQIEYKTCSDKVSESLYETVCSFLNHSGGKILIGVKDNGEIIGVNPQKVERIKNSIITTIKNTDVFLPCPYFTPQVIEVDTNIVLLLDIPCGHYVYRYNGRYWDRNGESDIDVTDQPELLLSLFERKNPHLFEERIVEGLTINELNHNTFKYCRNILAAKKPNHSWLQLTDEEILIHTRLAKRDNLSGEVKLKYAALILFGKDETIEEYMPRYRFEALFHMCTYDEYNNKKKFPNRYDDRKTMRSNLIQVYEQLTLFTERYLPNKFYLPPGTTRREDLRWDLFREIVANLCVHSDYSTGYACFYHVFKDRVVTKNPTRLLPEIPEGKLTLYELSNYTKNPLLVRVFHELSWVEDMGSGTLNILRYAPLYYPDYKVEISNGSQFIFSITYMGMSQESTEMSQENTEMSQENFCELNDEMLKLTFNHTPQSKKILSKKHKRQQGIVGLIKNNPHITMEEIKRPYTIQSQREHRIVLPEWINLQMSPPATAHNITRSLQ